MKIGKIIDTHEEKECCGSWGTPEKTKHNHEHHGHCNGKEEHTHQCNHDNEHVEVQK